MTAVRARAAIAAAALAATLACGDDDAVAVCPGDPVATFAFEGGGELAAPSLLPGEVELPACPEVPTAIAFTATVAFVSEDAAALCTDRAFADIATGTRAGDAVDLSTVSTRAILTQCGDGCVVEVRERLAGTFLPSAEAPERFEGALVDTVQAAAGTSLCGECVLPCAARYGILGGPAAETLSSPPVTPDPIFRYARFPTE